jgi:hypothetical protein
MTITHDRIHGVTSRDVVSGGRHIVGAFVTLNVFASRGLMAIYERHEWIALRERPQFGEAGALRAALHGFLGLELNGGFGLPLRVDASYLHLIELLEAGIEATATA